VGIVGDLHCAKGNQEFRTELWLRIEIVLLRPSDELKNIIVFEDGFGNRDCAWCGRTRCSSRDRVSLFSRSGSHQEN